MSAWEILKGAVRVGEQVETTLLGPVPYQRNAEGRLEAVITRGLKRSAEENGFRVLGADFQRNRYVLQRVS